MGSWVARLALALAVCIGLFGLAGSWLGGTPPHMFELDGEYTVPAAFSGALLFAAAYAAWRVNKLDPDRSWICLAILFAFMGVDEVAGLHEALTEWTGIHWQILYIPIVAIAAVGWLGALKRARTIGLAGGAS